jgi:hypothetical protein
MNKLFFNNIRNDYNNYENFEFIENFEVQNEQNEKIFFLSKKYTIVKLNQLIPANCCISISDKNFLKTVNNTYGCTSNQQFNTNCGTNINFWEDNNNKFIIIINKDPQNGYSNFATYLNKPVWLGTNNTLKYKFKTFINFNDANNYRNNYLNSTNYLYDIPSYLSYIKINKNDTDIIPLNLDNILLCGIEKNYWEKNINKIAIISYIPTYNEEGITNKPFAKYKNYNIWNYTTSELSDINDIIFNFIIPLNLSIGYKWIYNNLNSKLNLIVLNSSLDINSICTTFPSSCSIDSDVLINLNNNNIVFVVVQITNDIFNSPFAYLYNKQVSYICLSIKETIDDIIKKYNLINNKEYSNLLPINLKNIINNSENIFTLSKIQNLNNISDENNVKYKNNVVNEKDKNNIVNEKDENNIVNVKDENNLVNVKDKNNVVNVKDENNVVNVKDENNVVNVKDKNNVVNVKDKNNVVNVKNENNAVNIKNESNVVNVKDENYIENIYVNVPKNSVKNSVKNPLIDDDLDQQVNTMHKFNSILKIISSEDEQKYNNYLEKRLELIEKKREELRFIEMSNMSCCIIVSLIMLFVILIFTLCKKKKNEIE